MVNTGKLFQCSAAVFILVLIAELCGARGRDGLYLGPLSTQEHGVRGNVYVVDRRRLRVTNFYYDGKAPDAHFWIGIKGQTTSKPSDQGVIVPYLPTRPASPLPLQANENKSLVLTLQDGQDVNDIVWLSVWCKRVGVNFGDIMFPEMIMAPAPRNVGQFSRLAHKVRSGDVIIVDSRTVIINDLHYDGLGPDAFFWVGKGEKPDTSGWKIPDETGSLGVIHGYTGQTITLRLPESITFYDIDYLGMWCVQFTQNFGNVKIPTNLNVPPFIESTAGRNCEQMSKKLNVAWENDGTNITIELSAIIEADDYISFGVSGSSTSSSMFNADVTVVFYDVEPKSVDYTLTQYAQCSDGRGACPDVRAAGSEDTRVLSGTRRNGITSVTYTRPFTTGDAADKPIGKNEDIFIVWALGKLNQDKIVTKHYARIDGNVKLNFSRTPMEACPPLEGDIQQVTAWPAHEINGMKSTVFTVRIGPSGGRRGYNAITNFVSWGIAFYINNTLIPEITLKRGVTYTFLIQAGNTVNNTASYHPFYITDDPTGGYVQIPQQDRTNVKVFAGITADGLPEPTAVGELCEWEAGALTDPDQYNTFEQYFTTLKMSAGCSSAKAAMLKWTPDSDTPDTVYYQCYQHRYLGWKINVVDEYMTASATSMFSASLGLPVIFLMFLTSFIR